jgi:TPR repeat protein
MNYCEIDNTLFSYNASVPIIKTDNQEINDAVIKYLKGNITRSSLTTTLKKHKNSSDSNIILNIGIINYIGGYNSKAKKYFKLARSQNNPLANYFLARQYYYINKYRKVIANLNKCLEQTDFYEVYATMGIYYERVENDYKIAEECYLTAISKGSILAIYYLAMFYDNVQSNLELAEKYYCMASDKNYRVSKVDIITFYQKHNMVEHLKKACKHYAISTGNYRVFNTYNVIFDVADIDFVTEMLNNKKMKLINIRYTDELLVMLIETIQLSQEDLIAVNDYIVRKRSYNLYVKYEKLLNESNMMTLNRINFYETVANVECCVCLEEDNCISLFCHSSHVVCKDCILLLEICPYCEDQI